MARPSYTPSHARPAGQSARAGRPDPAPELTRYGPGVPATPPTGAAQTAERIWVTGRPDEPPRRSRRWRGLAGAALTVILLAASAVLLFLRFHHAPFDVTGVEITQRTQSGCGVNVTGQINTNGAAGTVSYQWLFRPDQQAPQPLSQSVVAGHNTVYVTVAVQGSGHGSASRVVTLQVLGPDRRAASTSVVLQLLTWCWPNCKLAGEIAAGGAAQRTDRPFSLGCNRSIQRPPACSRRSHPRPSLRRRWGSM